MRKRLVRCGLRGTRLSNRQPLIYTDMPLQCTGIQKYRGLTTTPQKSPHADQRPPEEAYAPTSPRCNFTATFLRRHEMTLGTSCVVRHTETLLPWSKASNSLRESALQAAYVQSMIAIWINRRKTPTLPSHAGVEWQCHGILDTRQNLWALSRLFHFTYQWA
jgi:hypothetical protein